MKDKDIIEMIRKNPNDREYCTTEELRFCFDLYNQGRADQKKKVGCCMACKHWYPMPNGDGKCLNPYFDSHIYTYEGFYCKSFLEEQK